MIEKEVWKFALNPGENEVMMPNGAEVLSVQVQHNVPCLWALVDPEMQKEERTFEVFGTGHSIKYDMGVERKYIGTFQLDGGYLVFHLFERIN